ncbi:FAD-dependent oxidoreductase [Poseidonibacter ostreae]|uniref:FAD-dependent oxidoreductase n=1 Tax=Poseidonibacter ostreae TaxID=2654171 RepID=A0A6L4WPU8_9BACT|nr:FAD-dependent oxidoreductase [Poseidonibacter ostreae]KAB7886223.1 FAD-dependent oxidoreductase [Poseidonibacter ostreae]KAB7886938.1 FAD-dependent oxidoreductase [Poseidonibacter ostreae]KAB7892231.1 FAD-dependent oxidoreductase [Poseidonibacter ostreae]
MSNQEEYDYVIVGAGIAGSSTAYFLSKYSNSILLIDKNEKVAFGASGAAGAFLSPLLGKPNKFKDLISKSLNFSTSFYKEIKSKSFKNDGVCRIPKNEEDREKFNSYKPYMDFEYRDLNDGYFFDIGSWINPLEVCDLLTKDINKRLSYDISLIEKKENLWILNNEIKTKNLILCTGANTKLIKEKYFYIRAVWGQKIDITTSTNVLMNYHKECSVSKAIKSDNEKLFKVSIGATHHRFDCDKNICNYCVEVANLNKDCAKCYSKQIVDKDSLKLIKLANDIIKLDDVNVIDVKIGARASSTDYFPMLGKLIDSEKSFLKFPHLINGTHIKEEMLEKIESLYVLNGVGGRGFVLSPYLANELVENIINNKEIEDSISTYRLFKRWAKKQKNKRTKINN